MYSVANFEISLTASDSDRVKIAAFLAQQLKNQADVFNVADWPATLVHVEELAIKLAKFAPQVSFKLGGNTVNDYGCTDYSFEYANGTLTACGDEDDEYDAINIQDDYPDYDEFCDRFWDEDNDCPMYTEEEYEEFCSWEIAFITCDDRILPDEPSLGAPRKFRITQDSVVLECSDDNWVDDFEDEED